MDTKTKEALEGSIEKWEKIVKGEGKDNGPSNCSLCQARTEESCEECPVMERTGEESCCDTPYDKWVKHHEDTHWMLPDRVIACKQCINLAQQEVDFLKSLRGPEKPSQPEQPHPQAGDVWEYGGEYLFVYETEGKLYYQYTNRRSYEIDCMLYGLASHTRIFSLTEHLMKEEGGK